VEVNF